MRMRDLTIIGRGPSWKDCQFNTKELWGALTCLAVGELKDKNYTKVFAFDDENAAPILVSLVEANVREIPVVSTRAYATELFPFLEIVKELRSSFFMPALSYALAYAIYLKYDTVYIHGIDAGPQWNYQLGKPHMVFWIGYAIARGIDVRLGRGSLAWSYNDGTNGSPRVFFENAEARLFSHLICKEMREPVEEVYANKKANT